MVGAKFKLVGAFFNTLGKGWGSCCWYYPVRKGEAQSWIPFSYRLQHFGTNLFPSRWNTCSIPRRRHGGNWRSWPTLGYRIKDSGWCRAWCTHCVGGLTINVEAMEGGSTFSAYPLSQYRNDADRPRQVARTEIDRTHPWVPCEIWTPLRRPGCPQPRLARWIW